MTTTKNYKTSQKIDAIIESLFSHWTSEKKFNALKSILHWIIQVNPRVIHMNNALLEQFNDINREYVRQALLILCKNGLLVKENSFNIYTKNENFFGLLSTITLLQIHRSNDEGLSFMFEGKTLHVRLGHELFNFFLLFTVLPNNTDFYTNTNTNIIKIIDLFIENGNQPIFKTTMNTKHGIPASSTLAFYNSILYDKDNSVMPAPMFSFFKDTNLFTYEFSG